MKNGINIGLTEKKTSINVVILLICVTGVLLRLFHYFYNRSLWMDEIYLSSSFLHFNYTELATTVLDHDQKAPLGFLWLVKLAVDLFGRNAADTVNSGYHLYIPVFQNYSVFS
jgi:hypothetical protein